MQFTLAQVAAVTGARSAASVVAETQVGGWSIDTRTLLPGDLYFAIKGEVHDGHAFVEAAWERGAVAAVVERQQTGPALVVRDTLAALTELARFARASWARPVVGVTGSAGKTSTKDIIAALLATRFRVGKTVGNFNNHIGLPLSLLRISQDSDVAVLEMGMNHAGEIRHLCTIAQPQVGVITNVGYAHVEFFDSIEGVAAAKRELIESLPANGTAVINADDERVHQFRNVHPGRVLTYGLSDHADVQARNVHSTGNRTAFTVNGIEFTTALQGEHSIRNILAAIAVAGHFGIPASDLASAVAALEPAKMRGQRTVRNGITILNDSYNSNPEAARSMVTVLRQESASRHIAVFGEMLELGTMSEALHRSLGRFVTESGVHTLIGIRGDARFITDEALAAGLPPDRVYYFDNSEEAGQFLRSYVKQGDALLFKGSRGVRVENAIATMER